MPDTLVPVVELVSRRRNGAYAGVLNRDVADMLAAPFGVHVALATIRGVGAALENDEFRMLLTDLPLLAMAYFVIYEAVASAEPASPTNANKQIAGGILIALSRWP